MVWKSGNEGDVAPGLEQEQPLVNTTEQTGPQLTLARVAPLQVPTRSGGVDGEFLNESCMFSLLF